MTMTTEPEAPVEPEVLEPEPVEPPDDPTVEQAHEDPVAAVPAVRDDHHLMVSHDRLELIRATLNPDLTDGELMLFGEVCNRVGLDPFARQIHAVKRGGRMTIQTGIDGFRLIARRTGEYGGRLGPYFAGPDGEWKMLPDGKPSPWLDESPPAAALVGVIRKGDLEPTWGVARWSEYAVVGRGDEMWRKMPTTMLGKCAEAQAHRATFPAETSGLYTDDEMMQADARIVNANATDHTVEIASEEERFEIACRIAALPEESQQALKERWMANSSLRGRTVKALPVSAARAANAVLIGVEKEATRAGWDRETSHAEIAAALVALAGQEPASEPQDGQEPVPAPETPEEPSEAASGQEEPPSEPVRTPEEIEADTIRAVKAMELPDVDAELRRLGKEVVGAGGERRAALVIALLVDGGHATEPGA